MKDSAEALQGGARASLGEILVRLGVITVDDLAEALPHCDTNQRNLLTVLSEMGVASEERLLKAISVRQKVPYFTTFKGIVDPEVSKLVPQKMSRKLLVVPVRKTRKGLLLAMVNPVDIIAMDTVASHTKLKILPVLTTRKNLFETISLIYDGGNAGAPSFEAGAEDESALVVDGAKKETAVKIIPRSVEGGISRFDAEDASVIEIVDGVISEAVATGASDIHLEPTQSVMRMRLRIDGILKDRRVLLKEIEPAIVARIKLLAAMDITETRLPQDGHISVDFGGHPVDLRVSTLPTIYGEKVVVRVLDQANTRRKLADIGLSKEVQKDFQKLITRPMGMLLVTGPTGSGKTSTLYASLNELNSEDRNIVTLEDPVEYRLAGINQMETNSRIGLTFATGLRSILRQDPNVILVGEIRDLETAEIAIQASITGHFVMSTLHTKDSVGTVSRLLNMKVEPFLLASALSAVLAQRLVRVLCPHCKKEQMPTKAEVGRIGTPLKEPGPFYSAVGCPRCLNLGYKGRHPIFEWLHVRKELRGLIIAGAAEDQLREAAKAGGLQTLQESALEHVYRGNTSLAEVIRVTHEEDMEERQEEGAKR